MRWVTRGHGPRGKTEGGGLAFFFLSDGARYTFDKSGEDLRGFVYTLFRRDEVEQGREEFSSDWSRSLDTLVPINRMNYYLARIFHRISIEPVRKIGLRIILVAAFHKLFELAERCATRRVMRIHGVHCKISMPDVSEAVYTIVFLRSAISCTIAFIKAKPEPRIGHIRSDRLIVHIYDELPLSFTVGIKKGEGGKKQRERGGKIGNANEKGRRRGGARGTVTARNEAKIGRVKYRTGNAWTFSNRIYRACINAASLVSVCEWRCKRARFRSDVINVE